MWLALLLDGYRSTKVIVLLLFIKGQGHGLKNFVYICLESLHNCFLFAFLSKSLLEFVDI